jgi:phosphoribosyl 1,2-cyclic phosphate phosphodiesterase
MAFLIDTPPEMRSAAIEYGIDAVDAVVLTHAHMDHVAGFDDVRRFNTLNGGFPLNCYAMPETIESMRHIFPYIGDRKNELGLYRPMVNFVDNSEPFEIGAVKVERIVVEHSFPCCGYLLNGRLGYISDCHELGREVISKLKGVEVLVINALRWEAHSSHFSVDEAVEIINRVAPREAYLTHASHRIGFHRDMEQRLPAGVKMAYDGLEIEINEE